MNRNKQIVALFAAALCILTGCNASTSTEPIINEIDQTKEIKVDLQEAVDLTMEGKTYAEDNSLADGKYNVSFVGAEVVKTDDGEKRLRAYYDVTNNTDDALNVSNNIGVSAFQDGQEIELENGSVNNFVAEAPVEVRPQSTVRITRDYVFNSDGGDVRLEANANGENTFVAETINLTETEEKNEVVPEERPEMPASMAFEAIQDTKDVVSAQYTDENIKFSISDEIFTTYNENYLSVEGESQGLSIAQVFVSIAGTANDLALPDELANRIYAVAYQDGVTIIPVNIRWDTSKNYLEDGSGRVAFEMTGCIEFIQNHTHNPFEVKVFDKNNDSNEPVLSYVYYRDWYHSPSRVDREDGTSVLFGGVDGNYVRIVDTASLPPIEEWTPDTEILVDTTEENETTEDVVEQNP